MFYGGGDCLILNIPSSDTDDIPEIVRRLEAVTIGCQVLKITETFVSATNSCIDSRVLKLITADDVISFLTSNKITIY